MGFAPLFHGHFPSSLSTFLPTILIEHYLHFSVALIQPNRLTQPQRNLQYLIPEGKLHIQKYLVPVTRNT